LHIQTNIPTAVVVSTNTTPVTGNFQEIQILEAATFSALAEANSTGQAMTGFVIAAGVVLRGQFSGYTLTSGKVRAYS
jgi:hypothetical protein